MQRRVTIDVQLIPTPGLDIEDTVEEMVGAMIAAAMEYGTVTSAGASDPKTAGRLFDQDDAFNGYGNRPVVDTLEPFGPGALG